jgi:hypothetical protein
MSLLGESPALSSRRRAREDMFNLHEGDAGTVTCKGEDMLLSLDVSAWNDLTGHAVMMQYSLVQSVPTETYPHVCRDARHAIVRTNHAAPTTRIGPQYVNISFEYLSCLCGDIQL